MGANLCEDRAINGMIRPDFPYLHVDRLTAPSCHRKATNTMESTHTLLFNKHTTSGVFPPRKRTSTLQLHRVTACTSKTPEFSDRPNVFARLLKLSKLLEQRLRDQGHMDTGDHAADLVGATSDPERVQPTWVW